MSQGGDDENCEKGGPRAAGNCPSGRRRSKESSFVLRGRGERKGGGIILLRGEAKNRKPKSRNRGSPLRVPRRNLEEQGSPKTGRLNLCGREKPKR